MALGLAFVRAINCLIELTGSEGCTTTSSGADAIRLIG